MRLSRSLALETEVMDKTEVDFIGKMILDEVMELFATVLPPAETKETMKGFINTSKDIAQIEGELFHRVQKDRNFRCDVG